MSNGVDVGLFLRIDGFMDQIKKVPGLTDKELGKIEKALDSVNKMPKRTAKAVDDAGKAMEKTIRSVGDATDSARKRFDDFNKGSKVIFGPMIDDVMDLKGGLAAVAETAGLSSVAAGVAGAAITGVGVAAVAAAASVAILATGIAAAFVAMESATSKAIELQEEFQSLNSAGADLVLLSPEALDSLDRAKLGFEALKIPFQELLIIAMDSLAPGIEKISRYTLALALEIEGFIRPIFENISGIATEIGVIVTGMFRWFELMAVLPTYFASPLEMLDKIKQTFAEISVEGERIRRGGVSYFLPDIVSEDSLARADQMIGALDKMKDQTGKISSSTATSTGAPTLQSESVSIERMVAAIRSLKGGITLVHQAPEVDKFTEFFDEMVAVTPIIEKHATLWERIAAAAESQRDAVIQSISDLGQIQGNLSSILGSRISELEAMKSNQNMSKQEIWLIDQKIAKNRAATEILFRAQQALSIANIAMVTAENIAKYAGNPFLMATAAAVGATSAAAVIAQSPPKYHSGMIPGEYPAVLTKGEAVLSRTGVAALGPDTVARANRGQSVSEGGSFFLALNNRVLDTLVSGAIRGGASTRLEIRRKSDTMLMMRRGIYA